MTTGTPEPTIKRCPHWCTLAPGHGWDSIEAGTERLLRSHAGRDFGLVGTAAQE